MIFNKKGFSVKEETSLMALAEDSTRTAIGLTIVQSLVIRKHLNSLNRCYWYRLASDVSSEYLELLKSEFA